VKKIAIIIISLLLLLSYIQIIFNNEPLMINVTAESSWVDTSDIDFNTGILNNVSVVGTGSSAELRLVEGDEGALCQNFGNGGVVLSNPTTSDDQAYSIAMDSEFIYVAGFDQVPGNSQWRIEKRNKTTGSLVNAFDGDGIVVSNPSIEIDVALSIAVDSNNIYIGGYINNSNNYPYDSHWRIEKRNKITGALVTGFNGNGNITFNPSPYRETIWDLCVDANYIYVAGYDQIPGFDNAQWRIEKRDITTGALITSFDGDGIINVNPGNDYDEARSISIDSNYLYISGYDTIGLAQQWHIEKRDITTGALITSFDGNGVIMENPSNNEDVPLSIDIDSNYIYIAGYDSVLGFNNNQWRIEKRDITTGALVTSFDGDGIIQSNPSIDDDRVRSIAVDSNFIYIIGDDESLGSWDWQWRIEKRDKSTGALITSFDDDGIIVTDPSEDADFAYAVAIDSYNMYVVGMMDDGDQWRIEKRSLSGLYNNTGYYFSTVFDTKAFGTQWNTINWTESLSPGTDITLTTRSGNTTIPDTSWTAWSAEVINSAGSTITSPRSRYIQYQATLLTSDNSVTPILNEITITYSLNTASAPISIAPENNTWINNSRPTFNWTFNDNEGDSQSYYVVEIDGDSDFSSIDHTSNYINSPIEYWVPIAEIPDGIWNWHVRTEDNYGKLSDNSSSMVLKIDKTPPVKFMPNADPSSWTNNSQPTISFSTTDASSGIDHYEVSIDNITFSEQVSPYILEEQMEGIHNITIRAYDLANNYYDGYVNVYIDLTPPDNLILSAEPDQWTNNNQPIITFSASDAVSGIDHFEIRINDGGYSVQTSPFTLPQQSDGIHNITLRAYDKAGNYKEKSIEIYIDTTPPHSLSILINDGATQTNTVDVSLNIGAVDDLSGLHQMAFCSDGTSWSTWEDYSETKSYSLSSGDGAKTIYFKVKDLAGNEADPVSTSIILNTTSGTNETDTDGDGYPDNVDAFPTDPNEWFDTDGDGHGDNSDAFIDDPSEWLDTDEDGTGNNADPDDDNDGLSDIEEGTLGTDPLLADTDGDSYNDDVDHYPLDSTKWEKENGNGRPNGNEPEDGDGDDGEDNTVLFALIGIIVIIIVVLILLFIFLKKKGKEGELPVEDTQPPPPEEVPSEVSLEQVPTPETPPTEQPQVTEVPSEQSPPPEVTPQVVPQVEPTPEPIPQVEEQPVLQVEPQPQVEVQEPQGQAPVPKIKTEPTIVENDT
jgi:hypothetical protein